MTTLEQGLWSASEVLRDHLDPTQVRSVVLSLLALRALHAVWPTPLTAGDVVRLRDQVVSDHPHLCHAMHDLPAVHPQHLARLGEALGAVTDAHALGRAYEYLLGRFAAAEGRRSGQYYTPASVVRLLADLTAPHDGILYDPCCGAGGMFVYASQAYAPTRLVGQECNRTTWSLAALNLAVHGLRADLGAAPADTLRSCAHIGLRADTILANPPFNLARWGASDLTQDPRFRYGLPPDANANLAWLQHILARLSPHGRAAVVLANGSLTTNQRGEHHIRHSIVQSGQVEAILALPEQLFLNTPIPACVWLLRGAERADDSLLMVDARQHATQHSRTQRTLDDTHIRTVCDVVQRFRGGDGRTPDWASKLRITDLQLGQPLTPGLYLDLPVSRASKGDLPACIEQVRSLTRQASELDTQLLQQLEQLEQLP